MIFTVVAIYSIAQVNVVRDPSFYSPFFYC